MAILVSACLMGKNCKYNGGNNRNFEVIKFLKDKDIIEICPEILAGLEIPRPCAEIVNDKIMTETGENVTSQYKNAVKAALDIIKNKNIESAILQSRSPTCGVNRIYDGTFNGKLIKGSGLFARALIAKSVKVIDAEDLNK